MEAPMAFFRKVNVRVSECYLLRDIDLKIERKNSLTILGPNGSGKSTLVKVMSGEIRPWTGRPETRCELFGHERWNLFELRHRMGLVSMDLQKAFIPKTKSRDVLISGFFDSMGVYKNHQVSSAMKKKCSELCQSLGIGRLMDREYDTLSLGEARSVLIARAMVNDPETLILDEPMTGLDITARYRFKKLMHHLIESGTALVLITHDLEDIPPNMGEVLMLKEGRTFLQGKKETLLNSENLSQLFDVPLDVYWSEEGARMRLATPFADKDIIPYGRC